MKFAINQATTMEYDIVTDIKAYHAAGITHMELWIAKLKDYLKDHEIAELKDILAANKIQIAGACAMGNLPIQDIKSDPARLEEFKLRLGFCRDLDCPSLVITSGNADGPVDDLCELMVPNLRNAADVAKDFGVSLSLEFLQRNEFIGTLATAKKVVRATDHPNVGLLIDCTHFWGDRSCLWDVADIKPEELLMVHLCDVVTNKRPETITDHDRQFPGKGAGIERDLIPAINATGYDGFWSLELFNSEIWKQPIDKIAQDAVASFEYITQQYGK